MSSYQSLSLAVPLAVAAGAAQDVNPRSKVVLGVTGTFVGTVQPQFSPFKSGDVWVNIGGAMTAGGLRELPAGYARRVRVNTTAYTSGTPVVDALYDTSLSRNEDEEEFSEESLAVPVSVAAGAALTLADGEQCLLDLSGTFVGTVQLQFSLSEAGSDWHNWGPALTAAGRVVLPKGYAKRVRANTTAYTSGTPVGRVAKGFAVEPALYDVAELVTSGALSLFHRTSKISVTGTVAYTLADGVYAGQRKSLIVKVAATTPDGTLTPANFADGTSIDLDAVNESCELEWDGAAWELVNIVGATVT